ncbi:thioredoxin domain-containing protein 12-like [Babylonia areolata]|uniref:thioredoxin domain-containing protein 12-like n=1 Tax=Babylonia areolata TaxID=304850 RepID=UPI003FD3CB54
MASTATMWLAVASLIVFTEAANELARGWGDNINWITLDKAWEKSKDEGKPVMLVIHKTWCGACKAFKPRFAESKDIEKLSGQFLMVNVQDDEEPSDDLYRPDGGYIPRILFFDSQKKLLGDVYNKNGNAKYKYYYSSPDGLVESMREVLKRTEGAQAKVEL